jgi:hypothetical protein
MRLRKLRIAWSVGWGLAAVALAGLWIRSHWRADILYGYIPQVLPFAIESFDGRLTLNRRAANQGWGLSTGSFDDWKKRTKVMRDFNASLGKRVRSIASVPHWLLAIPAFGLSAAPWIPWPQRFSYVGACQVTMGFTC